MTKSGRTSNDEGLTAETTVSDEQYRRWSRPEITDHRSEPLVIRYLGL